MSKSSRSSFESRHRCRPQLSFGLPDQNHELLCRLLSSTSLSCSSFLSLRSFLFSSLSLSFSSFFLSIISTARAMDFFSRKRFWRKNSYAPMPAKQKVPAAQLQAFNMGAAKC